jgi:voltage-gated potassium channel
VTRYSFIYLFAGLLILLLAEPFLGGLPKSGALIQLAFTTMMVVGVFSLNGEGLAFRLGVALAGVGLVAGVGYYATDSRLLRIVDLAAILGFCLIAIVVMFRQVVMMPGTVTINRLMGALCLYLLLGVSWAILFNFVGFADPGAFDHGGRSVGDAIEGMLYFSFVTLTTLGYGDVSPLHPVARTLAYLEAVVGQLYVAVLIASLVSRRFAGADPTRYNDGSSS